MSLEQQLEDFSEESMHAAPAERAARYEARIEELRTNSALEAAARIGTISPGFRLPDVMGELISLTDLLRDGPVVVAFYHGDWCPYCNIQLRAYKTSPPQMAALGAHLVAGSLERPEQSRWTAHTAELTVYVLSDVGTKTARRFGLAHALPRALRADRNRITKHCQESSATRVGNWRYRRPTSSPATAGLSSLASKSTTRRVLGPRRFLTLCGRSRPPNQCLRA